MEVCVNGKMSKPVCIDLSVPQGSINGPIYFTCYSSTLGRCIQNSQELIGYADDHALYDKFAAGNLDQERNVLDALSSTLDSVKNWMLSNHLKMNDDKTEFVIFGSSRMLPKCNACNIRVGDEIYSTELLHQTSWNAARREFELKATHCKQIAGCLL